MTLHSFHFLQRVPGRVLLCHLCGILCLVKYGYICASVSFLSVYVCVCVCVIAVSLSCPAAVLASGLFIVTAGLAVTANGAPQFCFGLLRRVCLELGRVKT